MPPGADPAGDWIKWAIEQFFEFLGGSITRQRAGLDGPSVTATVPIAATGYSMPTHFLHRSERVGNAVFGFLHVAGIVFHTLENYDRQISPGMYQVNWEPSPRLGRETFRLVHVPNRSGILIHPANLPEELEGCIALGLSRGELHGQPAILSSREAVKRFEDMLNRDSFMLSIVPEVGA